MDLLSPYLKILFDCGGYYQCPKNWAGERLGPLVGYAGEYADTEGKSKQYVGEVYYNFAAAEAHPTLFNYMTEGLAHALYSVTLSWSPTERDQFDNSAFPLYFLGAPMGGITVAFALAAHYAAFTKRPVSFGFAEKKVFALATDSSREQTALTLKRHEIDHGSIVILVEDVCNNFSTTDKMRELVEQAGAKVLGIACLLNRSQSTFKTDIGPVASLLNIPTQQWRQDNPAVADDIAAGKVVWKPKTEWPRLMAAMNIKKT